MLAAGHQHREDGEVCQDLQRVRKGLAVRDTHASFGWFRQNAVLHSIEKK